MRADLDAARTWLLATVAGWAVLVLGLALAGMGGRIEPLPVDLARLADLPQPRPAAASRIGPADQYMQVAARPVFDPGRRPRPFFIENTGAPGSGRGFDFTLSSVLIAPTLRMVILQPSGGGEALRVKLGEEPEGSPGWRLSDVGPRSAAFDGPEGRRTLELPIYAGSGQVPVADNAEETAAVPAAAAATSSPAPATTDVAASPERQLQQIRERIEARRAQLRQQQEPVPAAPVPPSPPPPR